MKKVISFILATALISGLASFSKPVHPSTGTSDNNSDKFEIIVLQTEWTATWPVNGCYVTVNQTVNYLFDTETFQLVDVQVVVNYIGINCSGNTIWYLRSGNDMSFDVNNGTIDDVTFAHTGERDIDDLYASSTFKSLYLNKIRSETPQP